MKKLKILFIRIAAMFIFNKHTRKLWRERHLDLTPRDGIDIHDLSPEELHSLRKRSHQKRWYRKLFNAIVPVTRAKLQHTERHILEEISRQNLQLQKAIRNLHETHKKELEGMQNKIAFLRQENIKLKKQVSDKNNNLK